MQIIQILLLILKSLTSNDYTVSDLFVFAEESGEQDILSEFFMRSQDVDTLFTDIPFEKFGKLLHNFVSALKI